jgi:Lhr-like helicase
MKTAPYLGIWMDHSAAHLIEFTNPMRTTIIRSAFTHREKTKSIERSESLMHHKEQHEQAAYYKKLGEVMRKYSEVLLFGPTDAKTELYNALKEDHLFEGIKMTLKPTDKMTEQQEHAFVQDYFSKIQHLKTPAI